MQSVKKLVHTGLGQVRTCLSRVHACLSNMHTATEEERAHRN